MNMEEFGRALERYKAVSVAVDKAFARLKSAQAVVDALSDDQTAARKAVQDFVEQHVQEARTAAQKTA